MNRLEIRNLAWDKMGYTMVLRYRLDFMEWECLVYHNGKHRDTHSFRNLVFLVQYVKELYYSKNVELHFKVKEAV